jgi:hypothetical protein
MLHPSATLGWEMLQPIYPAKTGIRRTLAHAHDPAAVAEPEQIQQLTIQHPQHDSLENVETMGQPPYTSTR